MFTLSEIMSKIVELLTPLESIDRQRVIQATLTILGETPIAQPKKTKEIDNNNESEEIDGISRQAKIWMKANGISESDLEQVFHISDGKVEVIISEMPGKSKKAKTINTYLLQGLSAFLVSGEAKFKDEATRNLCEKFGCFVSKSHAEYIKDLGNSVAGSKETDFLLTSPGLKVAAELIKEISKESK